MRFLLDTHALLWWVINSPKLSAHARELIADTSNEPVFSVVSAWEIVIKVGAGKLQLPYAPGRFVTDQLAQNGLKVLPIHLRHVLRVHDLPDHHRDPFDRLLTAQAIAENLTVLTADPLVTRYPIRVVW